MTYDDFLNEVGKRKRSEESLIDAARWFAAVTIAREALDSYSLKDWAHEIMDGSAPGSIRDEEELRSWFEGISEQYQEGYRDPETEGAAFDKWLISALDRHFGI